MGFLKTIKSDMDVIFDRDPAAKSRLEIFLCYPGFHALLMHRVAHWFYKHEWYLLARLISQFSRFMTLIEI
ncbi:MAG: serine O-acetyltransferase, partial [Candidatus Saccharibacteria bacterium]